MRAILAEMKRYSFLLSQFVAKDFKVKYRGSLLGVLWSALNPLLTMIVLSVVFSQVFRAVGNYQLYLLSGLLLFNFFSEATSSSVTSIVRNFSLITKVNIPRYILPLSNNISALIPLSFSLVIFLIMGVFLGLKFWIGDLLLFYPLICLFFFSIGVSFLLATWDVFFRDVQHLYSVIIMIWLYSTPVLYDITIIHEKIRFIFKLNPLYIFIKFFRTATLSNAVPSARDFLACAACALVSLLIGILVFRRHQKQFIFYT